MGRPTLSRLFRIGAALFLALAMAVVSGEAMAKVKRVKREPRGPGDYEAYRSEKLSDEDIRLLDYGRVPMENAEQSWVMEPCRDDIYGTWYELSGAKFFGEVLVAADFMIFATRGRYRYRQLDAKGYAFNEETKEPGIIRYLFELESQMDFGRALGPYVVFVNPPMSSTKYRDRGGDWTMRCVPDVALCDSLETAQKTFSDFEFKWIEGCQGIVLAPY
ncbi:MAG: hypothetical protein IT565_12620 [Rhodospirillales bacterium]|nr:hypothetical protein [Rhodospirillales bacterium]